MKGKIFNAFGGVDVKYYLRHLFFGSLIAVFLGVIISESKDVLTFWMIFYGAINTLLYPYSRMIYEIIVNFIMGDNEIWLDLRMMLAIKTIGMAFCWFLAIPITPIALYVINRDLNKAEDKIETTLG